MKLPKIFLPDQNLELKLEQLIQNPKVQEKEQEKPYDEELQKLFSHFNPVWTDYEEVHSTVDDLAAKLGYSKLDEHKWFKYDYWSKPAGLEESYLLTRFGKKYNKHYAFARIKNCNVDKFCKKLEYQRAMVYPKTFAMSGAAFAGAIALGSLCSTYPQGNFLKDMLSWMIHGWVGIMAILSIPRILGYANKKVGKGLDKYCTGLIIGDDKKALEAAFS
ncbi:hypothetical protein FJZ53_01150 [Candidatus Woesearchaeota archaeon]|nr:hypothetical protein [Candidatus Woesearchaeota archaeon]